MHLPIEHRAHTMAEANKEEAEKACRRAEELFLAGNIAGALRLAGRAQRLFPSIPGAANTLAAYDVHAAAAANPDCPDWHAVLGVDRSATGDAVKKQFRRRSLLVHPDKNRSAAAEGAFKLLSQACDALSAGHDPNAAAAQDWWRSHTAKYPAKAPASEPNASAPFRPPRQIRIRCENCRLARQIDPCEVTQGARCLRCRRWLTHTWQRKAYWPSASPHPMPRNDEPSTAPQRQKPPTFPCPAQCPHCRTQFTSMVSAGPWKLRCKACQKSVMVNVQGPDAATCMRTTTS